VSVCVCVCVCVCRWLGESVGLCWRSKEEEKGAKAVIDTGSDTSAPTPIKGPWVRRR
jgi:hypothetical protein